MENLLALLDTVLDVTVMTLALLILLGLLTVAVLYVVDVTQNTQAIRKNYPVIGRLRYVFEHRHLGRRQRRSKAARRGDSGQGSLFGEQSVGGEHGRKGG